MPFDNVLEHSVEGFERVESATLIADKSQPYGLRAIIAVHSTKLGSALGGTRMFAYAGFEDAMNDVLKLAEVMTYKASLADLNLGGGKAVIIGDPQTQKTPQALESFSELLNYFNRFGPEFYTAEDSGTTCQDMDIIGQTSDYVVGRSTGNGNPAPVTARGVFEAIEYLVPKLGISRQMVGISVAVQGVGQVGMELIELLVQAGCQVSAFDFCPQKVDRAVVKFGINAINQEELYQSSFDVFCPCGFGNTIGPGRIPQAWLIAGAANNQIKDPQKTFQILGQNNIFYAPDFLINAGGVICVAGEILGYSREEAIIRTCQVIPQNLQRLLEICESRDLASGEAALKIARERLSL